MARVRAIGRASRAMPLGTVVKTQVMCLREENPFLLVSAVSNSRQNCFVMRRLIHSHVW